MAISEKDKKLISYLLGDCSTVYCITSKIKIIKLLYLIDVECARRLGEKYSDVPWRFYFYGPYDSDVDAYLISLGLEDGIEQSTFQTQDGKTGTSFRSKTPAKEKDVENPKVRKIIHDVVQRWASKDTYSLLDYVYFDTEPMQVAKKGQELDFGTIQVAEPEQIIDIKADQDKLAALRKRVKEYQIGKSFLPEYKKMLAPKPKSFIWDDPINWSVNGKCFFDSEGADK